MVSCFQCEGHDIYNMSCVIIEKKNQHSKQSELLYIVVMYENFVLMQAWPWSVPSVYNGLVEYILRDKSSRPGIWCMDSQFV